MKSVPETDNTIRRFSGFPRPAIVGYSSPNGWHSIAGEAVPAALAKSAVPTTRVGRILVVDDDAGISYTISQILCDAGHRVSIAADGEAGWVALRAGEFDVLITDHEMPRLTGLELLRRLRSAEGHLPAILMSGRMPPDGEDFLRLHPPGLTMAKPFSRFDLLANVQRMLAVAGAVSHRGRGS